MEEVAEPPMKRGQFSRRYGPKEMGVRQPTAFDLRNPYGKICHVMLEKYVSLEYKEELF